jgi:uncharacterized protein (TIGR02265 family)
MNSVTASTPSVELGSTYDMEQRLAVLKPTDTTRGFLFGAALDLVKAQAGEEGVKRCVDAAGGGKFTAFFSYPVSTFLKLTYAAAHELSAKNGGFEAALQLLGARVAPSFLESTTGKMLISLVGKEPKRLMDSMPTAYKTAWDHGSCSLTWTGPQSGRFTYSGNVIPAPYFAGSVQQILSAAQLKGAKVSTRQASMMESLVDFSWG